MATGNHFWLDIVAGIVVALVAAAIVNHKHVRALRARRRPVAGLTRSFKERYTTGVRRGAARSMGHLATDAVSPDALTFAGVTLCAVAAVIVYFEYKAEILCFWLGAALFVVGSVLDILDGALARSSGKGTPFGAFLDSTTDRVGEAFMLGAIALVFSRDGNEVALAFAFAAVVGSFLVSYTRARAEALGLKGDVGIGSRAERVVVIVGRARPRAVGRPALGDLPAGGHGLDHRRPAQC